MSEEMPPHIRAALIQAGYDPKEFKSQGTQAGSGAAIGGGIGAATGLGLGIGSTPGKRPLYPKGLGKSALAKWLLKEYGPSALVGGGIGALMGGLAGSGTEVWEQMPKGGKRR